MDARKVFTFLGVCCDLSKAEEGWIVLSVAESRRMKLASAIVDILERAAAGGGQLSSLCSMLQFTL